MSHPNIDKIEIVEPPIEELVKRPSVWKRAAALGCGGLLLLLILLFVGIKIALGPGPSTLHAVPDNFPPGIPVYDKDNIERVTFIPGRYKNRAVEIAALFPKIILAPLFISLDNKTTETATGTEPNTKFSVQRFWQVVTAPVGNAHDTVQIEWRGINAGPKFIYSYYKSELKKQKYLIDSETQSTGFIQFSFSAPSTSLNNASGFFIVQGDNESSGADFVSLTVNYSASATTSPQTQ